MAATMTASSLAVQKTAVAGRSLRTASVVRPKVRRAAGGRPKPA